MVVTKNKDAVVRTLTRADMESERAELLRASGMSEDELRTLGATWELDADRRGILARIDSLDFLLANTPGSVTPRTPTLARLAEEFATELTHTVRAVVGPGCPAFIADTPEGPDARVVSVRQEPASGITLLVGSEPVLTLTAEFRCTWDGHGQYLAVHWSRVAVFPRDDLGTNPLLRYDYVKDMRPGLPAAHLQVHGSHEALSEILREAGRGSLKGKRRVKAVAAGRVPALSELHFPLGGHRFRPCLEDILAVLMEEFGVTPAGDREAALEALAEGRETWRRRQIGAAVRDAPDEAIRVLEDLGYDVRLRDGREQPRPQTTRLRAL